MSTRYKLKEPKDSLGYSRLEISEICLKLKIQPRKFWKAFGVNTCAVGEDGTSRFYKCDVERALYDLNEACGVYHPWD